MNKTHAIEKLGGSIPAAAAALKVSYQAIRQWPEELSDKIAARVFVAFVQRHPTDWHVLWPDLVKVQAAETVPSQVVSMERVHA